MLSQVDYLGPRQVSNGLLVVEYGHELVCDLGGELRIVKLRVLRVLAHDLKVNMPLLKFALILKLPIVLSDLVLGPLLPPVDVQALPEQKDEGDHLLVVGLVRKG